MFYIKTGLILHDNYNNKREDMTSKFSFVLLFLIFSSLLAQNKTPIHEEKYVPGEMIVMLNQNSGTEALTSDLSSMGLVPVKQLSKRLNIWLFSFTNKSISDKEVLSSVKTNKAVKLAQFNHYVQKRDAINSKDPSNKGYSTDMIPNDPSFGQQWALNNTGQTGGVVDADIDAVEAWDLSYGGPAATGDEIVIAIVDGGADLSHQDINFWKNVNEIPNNNIDDDNNGYIDDYDGWDAYNSDGSVPSDNHGTHVSGIAAAVGNNSIGVSGVNPNAKILPVAGSSGTESIVVEAYGYVLELRSTYNETNGAEGAFIVVTNASFGVDYADPADYPIWCAMYDELGAVGILNCGATANLNINIDIQGDVPTACPSDYMIAVTNTTDTDTKNSGAAYGATTIDLGAPGTSIYNTLPGNSYGSLTGTSMATPTVAGAIALMYSAANQSLMQAYKDDPGTYALIFRQHLLDNVDPIVALNGITVTGGRLNVHNALLMVIEEPDDVPPSTITDLMVTDQTSNSLFLSWSAPYDTSRNGVVTYDLRWSANPILNDNDFANATMLEYNNPPADSGEAESFMIEGLDFATTYHFAIKSKDIWGNTSEVSNNAEGTTWGAPEAEVSPSSISVNLDPMSSTIESFNVANVSADNSSMDFSIELANNTFPAGAPVQVKLIPKSNAIENTDGTKEKPYEIRGVSIRGSGGPDLFGYEWIDSNDPEGPDYVWEDISSTGTAVTNWTAASTYDPEDEGYAGPLDIGFNFKYYGITYSDVYIGSNGFITFEEFEGNTFTNPQMPSSSVPNNIIAAFWDDLDGSDRGEVYTKQDGNRFIVQFDHWPRFYGQNGQDYTFQIVLYSSGKIMLYYESLTASIMSGSVGIENYDGTDGLQIAYNVAYLEEGLAVKISAEPDWLASDILEGTIFNGNSVDVELTFTSEDLPEGTYSMDVVVSTNDPSNPEIVLPVEMVIGNGGSSDNWSADILVSDAGGVEVSNTLTFGQDPMATDGIDVSLDEFELPPLPPAGVFDTRFKLPGNIGSLADIRNSSLEEVSWEVNFQPGAAGYPITLSWNPNNLPDGSVMLKDAFGGSLVNVNMHQESSVEITNTALTSLLIEYMNVTTIMVEAPAGWNIVSAPMDMDDMSVSAVYPDAVSQAFGFDNGYYTVTTCTPGYGYWVKFDDAVEMSMSGQPTGNNVQISAGWNLIGPMDYEMDVNFIGSSPAGILSTSFYEFNAGYSVASSLIPGHGYWVKSTSNGELTYTPVAKSQPVVAEDLSKLSRIIVTDVTGKSAILRFGGEVENELRYELPPVPPAGVFDVRFSTDRSVTSNLQNEIKMQGLEYPVTISAEGTAVKLSDNLGGGLVNATLKSGEELLLTDSGINSLSISSVEIPVEFALGQNYPNPFNPSTKINFALPVDSKVTITLYNMLGEKVKNITTKDLSAGVHELTFNASELASGMYIYTITASGVDGTNFNATKKMMLMK